MVKRSLDVVLAAVALVVLSPLWVVAAWKIVREDPGPLIYKGTRVGKDGRQFKMWKFRTMVQNAERIGGPSTAGDDSRLLRSSSFLRKYKIDEIPQLVNVLKGDMSLVGPRPEVPFYTDMYRPEEREILSVRPGVTDWASIRFRNEGEILRGAPDPEQAYMEKIRPEKIRLGLEYVRRHSIREDCAIIVATINAVTGRPVRFPAHVERPTGDAA
jgi:lipopolysaccharide/colanic/teichoic acid biosynthesis glycosyltransferase